MPSSFYGEFGSSLTKWPQRLVELRGRDYAKAVFDKGSPLESVIGFLDGTAVEIARPSGARQRPHAASIRGKAACSSFSSPSNICPRRLGASLVRPMEGRRHDMLLV
jgi:hypothetical protein